MNKQASILIIDNEESTCRNLSLIFENKGYETETARTGQEALEKAQGRFFNLALLDVRLPDVEGIDLLTTLREMYPDMVIIMAAAHISLETAVWVLNKGASAYIIKPLNTDEVLTTVRQALEKQRLVLENKRLYEEAKRHLAEARLIQEVMLATASTLDFDLALERTVKALHRALDIDRIGFLLPGERGGWLVPHPSLVGQRGKSWENAFQIPIEGSLAGQAYRTGQSVLVRDIMQEPVYLEGGPEVRSTLAVPVRVGDRIVAVLQAESPEVGAFGKDELRLFTTVAGQLGVTLENTRLFQAEREQRELAEALEEAAAAVNSTLDLDQVLDRILEQVARIVAGDAFNVMLIDDDTARMVRWRGYEYLGLDGQVAHVAIPVAKYPSLLEMTRTKGPVVIPDTATDPDWIPLEGQEWRRSYVAAPIRVKDLTVGFLNVNGTRPGQFSPADGQRLEAFAAHAATAVENAHLYRELFNYTEELEQRVQERTAQFQAHYARLDAILRSTTNGIIVTDTEGEITQTNPVAQTWLTQTLSPEDSARLEKAVWDLARQAGTETVPGKRPETVLELTGLDLELKAAPVMEEETKEPAAVVVAVHDVSHLKALGRVKSHFVTHVSHELRTPITTIKLYVALMQQQPEKWQEYLAPLAQEANRQAQLVENILQISYIDAGRLEIKPCPTPLNQLTEETVVNRQAMAQERGLTLEYRPFPTPSPSWGEGRGEGPVSLVDPVQMMQVLDNLVENAIRYTPEGGKVIVSTGKKEAEGRTWVTATVADTGMGIPEDELPHVFERFFRGERPQLMQMPGTGLGLAIVKEIVELHGGRVTVESQVDVGTTLTVWLPPARLKLEEES